MTVDGARFCEACGAELEPVDQAVEAEDEAATDRCVSCDAEDSIDDGYCLICGYKQPAPRDHVEIDLGTLAGVSDRGRRHRHNEDAMAFAVVPNGGVVVVCDGVSTTDNSDTASQVAVDAALATLLNAVKAGTETAQAMSEAALQAQAAVVQVPPLDGGQGNPSCTFVAAVVQGAHVTVAWLGDSRAYWLGDKPALLTTDHSWAAEVVTEGTFSPEQAAADPRASTITRWLGRDAPNVVPSVASFTFQSPGRVVVCSDGLWNYLPDVVQLAGHRALNEATLLEQAIALTAFANESGGHDNITVALVSTSPLADTDPAAP